MLKKIVSFIMIMTLLLNINVMGVSAASTEAPNPELSGILEEPATGVEYILYNPDVTTSTSGKPIIFVFHGMGSSESELDAGGGLAAYQLISRDVINPNALIVFVRKDYGNWADNSEYSLKSQIYATFIHNMISSTGADTSHVYYYGFSMGAWDGPAIIKASGEGTFKAAVFNDGNPFSYITNDDLEQYVLNNNGVINGNAGNQNIPVVNDSRGVIFIGESHVHKLEEGMTQNNIAWEQPSTYLSNTITTRKMTALNTEVANVNQPIEIDTASYGLTAENVSVTANNISNEYKIAWISDLHMMLPKQTFNQAWYDRQSITPADRIATFLNSHNLLSNLVNCINNNDFDAVVFGGDIIDNYSSENYAYLQSYISQINKTVIFLAADHDYLTEMTTNTGVNKATISLDGRGNANIKQINIGKNGENLVLIAQSGSNEPISSADLSTVKSILNNNTNTLFFTHVPIEPQVNGASMQQWSKDVHNNQVYYWSPNAYKSSYVPSGNQQELINTLYQSSSLKGVFTGHMHASYSTNFSSAAIEHVFDGAFRSKIGVITVSPSANNTPVENVPTGEIRHTYTYDYGVNGNGNNGNMFFIHTLSAVGATEPEYGTPGQGTQQAFPEWLYDGDGTTNGIRTYQGTATAYERAKKIISNNPDINSWTVIVMQGYFTPGLGVNAWDKYISNLNSMKTALEQIGCNNFYVSSSPHTNADIWEQTTCYAYGNNAVIANLQGTDVNTSNANIDQYNSYVKARIANYIDVTDSSGINSLGKDGNAYRQYKNVGVVDSSFCFDKYAHIDMNHYDASTMYAWAEYLLNYIDEKGNQGGNNNTNNVVNNNGTAHKWLGLDGIYLIEGTENHYDVNASINSEKGRNAMFLAGFSGNLRVEDYSGKSQDWVNGFGAAVKNGDAAIPPWNCAEAGDAYNWLLQNY